MPPDSTTAYLERHQPEKNMRRYYRLYVTPTLFGEFALVREWGRIGKSGQRKEEWYDTFEQACVELERLASKKRRKGYCDVCGI
ncbi:WGR domain-containing protein [Pontibacter diazotrophicus]|uniref:WGR domain-containing protein n=1 Tax=Pontibacter diazotrophicus TaxID=1400979 RepID=A0A3D8L3L9_9BACT|nr:WGR domain-containing protein [Pontibacter diazotrophicus]RDV11857.1 WGR domain-containing protein [Pontibacter diazotrophicus]